MLQVNRIDHLVLTVKDIATTVDFYTTVLGMNTLIFGENRIALTFGDQKINLHQLGNEFEPKAGNVNAGSADICFIIDQPVQQAIEHLNACDVKVLQGPVSRTGATGEIVSIYFRDPDDNLIEVSNYVIKL
jgi:catechol 2,3-dioxygenase-like lactoylglutathione lyase family enzyme